MTPTKTSFFVTGFAMIGIALLGSQFAGPKSAVAETAAPKTTATEAPTETAPAADGVTLLTVTHEGEQIVFDRAALEALPRTQIETSTIWTEGLQQFDGVSLKDLLDHAGVSSGVLQATAINDYSVTIPVEDAVEGGPIIAYLANGAPMSRRDKGPLWIVYPYDDNPDYQAEVIYSRSIWQLDRLIVE